MLSLLASLSVHSLERLDFMAFKLSRLEQSTYGNIIKCAISHCDEVLSLTVSVVSGKRLVPLSRYIALSLGQRRDVLPGIT